MKRRTFSTKTIAAVLAPLALAGGVAVPVATAAAATPAKNPGQIAPAPKPQTRNIAVYNNSPDGLQLRLIGMYGKDGPIHGPNIGSLLSPGQAHAYTLSGVGVAVYTIIGPDGQSQGTFRADLSADASFGQ